MTIHVRLVSQDSKSIYVCLILLADFLIQPAFRLDALNLTWTAEFIYSCKVKVDLFELAKTSWEEYEASEKYKMNNSCP